MIKHYFFATYNIKNRFISHTSKGEFSVVFLKFLKNWLIMQIASRSAVAAICFVVSFIVYLPLDLVVHVYASFSLGYLHTYNQILYIGF